MGKHIIEKRKKRKLVVREESSDSGIIPETPLGSNSLKLSQPLILTNVSLPTTTVPLKIVVTKPVSEEVPISTIVANVSDTGAHVCVSVDPSSQGIPTISSSEHISSTFVSLPPFIQHISTTTTSPTFDQELKQPITKIFQSQSTDPPKPNSDDETDGEGFRGTFADLEFDSGEENIADHMLMSGKQFKILNRKLNSILQ